MYRNHYDVTASILNNCKETISKTKLMYCSFLSYTQLKSYTANLIENCLIVERNGKYLITERGKEFLDKYNEIKVLIGTVDFTKPANSK